MSLPTVTQTWTMSLNNRYVYNGASTIVATMGAMMFSFVGVGGFLTSTMGYTVKGSCDGTTGAMDGVNRITAANKWATRATIAGAAQSWIVLTDGAGINWLFTYQSTGDDICRLSHSTGGNYIAAGTPAQQPTATDECFDTASGSWINNTTSIDRVWHMWGTSDKKMFRLAVFRASTLISFVRGEKFLSTILSPATFTLGTGGGTVSAIKGYYTGASLQSVLVSYSAAIHGDLCRVHSGGQDVNAQACGSGEVANGASSNTWNVEKPALQGGLGETLFPLQVTSQTAFADGKLGSVIDHWYAITSVTSIPASGDTFGNLQFFCVLPGGAIWPLDGITSPAIA